MSIEVKRIMGIDPGTNRMGYGILEICNREPRCVVLGDIDLTKLKDPYIKLQHIFRRVTALIEEYSPDHVALESPFFGENVQSMLKLGRAQGVAMAAALNKDLPVFEYAPLRVKQAITGHGGAAKEQVASMLKSMLGIEYNPKRLDATDGLAVALCHYFVVSSPIPQSTPSRKKVKNGSWEQYLATNPEREIKQSGSKHKSNTNK